MGTKVENKMQVCETLDLTKDWNEWRESLKEAIAQARAAGVSDEEIQNLAVQVGDYLSNRVCAETKEEELLRDMWTVADEVERKSLARLIFKMVE